MARLRDIQSAVAQCILSGTGAAAAGLIIDDAIPAADRLSIYRNTVRGTLVGALRLTYPAVEKLVGKDFFESAAAAFIGDHVPRSAYLNEYGAGFAAFLAAFPPAASLSYLPDVARLEWAMSCVACAEDMPPLDPRSLVEGPAQTALSFIVHPAVRLIELSYPADEIWRAVIAGDDAALGAIDVARGAFWLLIQRLEESVVLFRLSEGAGRFTAALCAGVPLAEALSPEGDTNLVELLAEHLAKGRFAAVVTQEIAS